MNSTKKLGSDKAWSQYWKTGVITSFSDTYSANYEGFLSNYWTSFCEQHDLGNSSILDVGTGNGAIINLIEHTLATKNLKALSLVGIDSAEIIDSNRTSTLIGEMKAESMGFDDDTFDFVVSQYGFEYSEVEKSIFEIARVLRNGGRINFLCHCSDSIIVQENILIYKCNKECYEMNVFDAFKSVLELLENNMNTAHTSEEDCFNESMSFIYQKYGEVIFSTGFPQFVKEVLHQPKNKIKFLEQYIKNLDESQVRLEDLINAAITDEKKRLIVSFLKQAGFKNVESVEKYTGKQLIGVEFKGMLQER